MKEGKKMDYKSLQNDLVKFKGVLCSGFFIADPKMVTALALLFEEVHFLNHLDYIKEFSKKYRIIHKKIDKDIEIGKLKCQLTPMSMEECISTGMDTQEFEYSEDDPLIDLTEQQKNTVYKYLMLSRQFCLSHATLFGDVFKTDMYPDSEVFKVDLIKKNITPDGKNQYEVKENKQLISAGQDDRFSKLLYEGAIPIVANTNGILKNSTSLHNNKSVASFLAMQSISMMFPGTKETNASNILEARHKLRNELPPFWSSMLKLSNEMNHLINEQSSTKDLICESSRIVETIVRPSLIDLTRKLEYEKKDWFHKILSPVSKGLRILAGKPPVNMQELLSSSLLLGADVATDFSSELKKVEMLKRESGLVYLLELGDYLRK